MIAILEAQKLGLLHKQYWFSNIVSGIIVGVVALPLAMAFAIASGVNPEHGLYTSIIAGFIVSACGGSRVQIAGPTGAFVVVLSGITAKYGFDGLQIATCMAGLILLGLGLSKMGSIIKFIPAPVIVGFTAGIAVIIWIDQWKEFFGLPEISGQYFHNKLFHLIQVFPQLDISTTALATLSLFIVIFSPKIHGLKRIPSPLVALIIATLIQITFNFDNVRTIKTAFGGIPSHLPNLTIPSISVNKLIELIGPAFAIAMLGAIESLLSAVVADGMTGTRHNSNQELIGQGLANVVTPFFGGFAATGAIARTATNIRNGGTSPLSGIVHSITLVIILLLLAPLASHIPLCALAAILFLVAWNMSETKHFIKMVQRAPNYDTAILVITFLLTVFADLVIAVNIGVILATLNFLHRMSIGVEITKPTAEELNKEFPKGEEIIVPDDTLIFTVDGPFFFGAVENFEHALAETYTDPKYLIIRLRWVPFMDITGLQTLEETIQKLQKRHVIVMISGANDRVTKKLYRAGIIDLIGKDHFFTTVTEAIRAITTQYTSKVIPQ